MFSLIFYRLNIDCRILIKIFFKSNLSSAADCICCYFIRSSIELEYFINTSKTNLTNKLLSASTGSLSNLLCEDRLITLIEELDFSKIAVLLKNSLREDFINCLLHQSEHFILIISEKRICASKFIKLCSQSFIEIRIAERLVVKTISNRSASISTSNLLCKSY